LFVPIHACCHSRSAGQVGAQEYAYQEDFEDGQAQDWTLDPSWQVIQDEGNYVLSGQEHNWARAAKVYDTIACRPAQTSQGQVHLNFRMTMRRISSVSTRKARN